jgi:indolepyruvate ferredoxin oxidoreductase, alpha subunit
LSELAKVTLTSDAPGTKLFMLGNEAIARGALEAGVQVVAAYPGTPSTEAAETLIKWSKEQGFYAEWSVNEKVAYGVALGASWCNARAMAIMKHVGVNLIMDQMTSAGYVGAVGGFVLVEAEDPGQWSSQVEQDNRYLAEMSYIPMLEPSSAQEAKEMVVDAFNWSEEFKQPFILRSVTRVGHARGDVQLGAIRTVKNPTAFNKDPARFILLPTNSRKLRIAMVEKLARIKEAVNGWKYNSLAAAKNARYGIITAGISYSFVLEALRLLGLNEKVSVLKIGTPYPLPEKMIKELINSVSEVLVVEELEPFIETRVKAIAHGCGSTVIIHGKDLVPLTGELSTRLATEALVKLSGQKSPIDFTAIDDHVQAVENLLPSRPPSLCSGCPHRGTYYALNRAYKKVSRELKVEPVRPCDIGCYCLGANPPLNAFDTSTCMGGGFDIANGIARAVKAPVIAQLGDSTFFHSGIAPMVNAVFNRTKMAMLIMDNGTTAMTGSQPDAANPGNGEAGIKPEDVARACNVKFVEVVNAFDIQQTTAVLEKALLFEGPAVVVSRGLCAILAQRDRRARGAKVQPYRIEQNTCTKCKLCVNSLGCPAIVIVNNEVVIDAAQCEGCSVCAQVCPTQSIKC